MNNLEFQAFVQQLEAFAHIVDDMDIAGFQDTLTRVDTVGPIIDPTKWIAGQPKIRTWEIMAEGLAEFQKAVKQAKREAK